jgi:hypothetical protein
MGRTEEEFQSIKHLIVLDFLTPGLTLLQYSASINIANLHTTHEEV